MKLSIITDTHFGDDSCLLVTEQKNGDVVAGPKYQAFIDAAGKGNDYLVLGGDVFDFSIATYATAYKRGKAFFQFIKRDDIAKEIIYLAGNHDADIWHIVQHQRSVINRIAAGKFPESFQHSVAGVIDDRKNAPRQQKGLALDRTTAKGTRGKPRYGGMFLDTMTDPATTFNFAYPNLYIVTDEETALVTHGQYLEGFWAILGEMAQKLAYEDLNVGDVDVEEMVEMNFPLNQLACTGIGQAGVLTAVARKVQVDVKNGDLKRVTKYMNRLEKEIDDLTDYGWIKELVVDFLIGKVKDEILDSLGGTEQSRYSEDFISKKDVKARFKRFYASSLLEIGDINNRTGQNIPAPWRIIFGHTHQPIPWDAPNRPKLGFLASSIPKPLMLSNGGGWIVEGKSFCGAEVFTYETGKGFGSISIR
ncbi:MAG: metallophosphoesterase [Desulfobacterota bacterium]|jgi:predicted phosphodiesterase|nr:metallophosphoesterase [Thermodesulfobacteriota bacterium]